MKKLLSDTTPTNKKFKQFYLEVNTQMVRIVDELIGIDWDDMTKAEQRIWMIVMDSKKSE